MANKEKKEQSNVKQGIFSCLVLGLSLGVGAYVGMNLPKEVTSLNAVKASVLEIDEIKKAQEEKLNQVTEETESLEQQIEEAKDELSQKEREKGTIPFNEDELKYAYLTFDDGPSHNTPKILDFLKANNIKGTFFVIGVEGYDDIYKRIVDEGHTLALHSETHAYNQIYQSIDAFKQDLNTLSDRLERLTGQRPIIMRFPGGSNNTVSNRYGGVGFMDKLTQHMADEGYLYYDWNVDSMDASAVRNDKNVIVNSVLNNVGSKEHAVILMHDAAAKTTTVEALPEIVQGLRQKGFLIAPLQEDTPLVQFK